MRREQALLDDSEDVILAQGGDMEAFSRLIEQHTD